MKFSYADVGHGHGGIVRMMFDASQLDAVLEAMDRLEIDVQCLRCNIVWFSVRDEEQYKVLKRQLTAAVNSLLPV